MRSTFCKRLLDVVGAAVGLTVASPFLLIVAAAVRRSLGSPILFRQKRPGYAGKPFVILKFRTMRDAATPDGQPLSDADRMTPLGRFLRTTSLDELPELLNVLTGDMSLVGPRPLLMEYLPRYDNTQRRRHDVKPGITGWAQINGRNALDWDEKFKLDVWYVDNWSNELDVTILLRTVKGVIKREGIGHGESETMPNFMGNFAEPGLPQTPQDPVPS